MVICLASLKILLPENSLAAAEYLDSVKIPLFSTCFHEMQGGRSRSTEEDGRMRSSVTMVNMFDQETGPMRSRGVYSPTFGYHLDHQQTPGHLQSITRQSCSADDELSPWGRHGGTPQRHPSLRGPSATAGSSPGSESGPRRGSSISHREHTHPGGTARQLTPRQGQRPLHLPTAEFHPPRAPP